MNKKKLFELCTEYENLNHTKKQTEVKLDEVKEKIKKALKDPQVLEVNNQAAYYKVSYNMVTTSRLDTHALKHDHAELYKQYCNESTYDRLTVSRRA
jgi:predicted phage-related endonuclease